MKRFCALWFFLLTAAAHAQTLPAQSITRGAWEFQPFVGGGTGLGHADTTQFLIAGGRIGKIITSNHLDGWLRKIPLED